MNATFNRIWYAPAFSSLLEKRQEGLVIVGVGALHLGMSLIGLPVWGCPIRAVTGMPCPGCGLTNAVVQLLRGEFADSIYTHAFAPVFLVAILVMLVALALPEKYRCPLLSTFHNWEIRSGLAAWILSGLMIYWIVRLMGILPFPKNF